MHDEVAQSAHTSELPSNIEDSEPSTPLPAPLIMPSPQPLNQGQVGRGRRGGCGLGRGCQAARDDPYDISQMQVYDRQPQRKKKVPSCATH